MARSVGILGSTGSIGTQTLSVIRELSGAPESESNPHFTVKMLACGRNRELMLSQIKEFRPGCVCVACERDAAWLSDELSGCGLSRTEILYGEDGLVKAAACFRRSRQLTPAAILPLRTKKRSWRRAISLWTAHAKRESGFCP